MLFVLLLPILLSISKTQILKNLNWFTFLKIKEGCWRQSRPCWTCTLNSFKVISVRVAIHHIILIRLHYVLSSLILAHLIIPREPFLSASSLSLNLVLDHFRLKDLRLLTMPHWRSHLILRRLLLILIITSSDWSRVLLGVGSPRSHHRIRLSFGLIHYSSISTFLTKASYRNMTSLTYSSLLYVLSHNVIDWWLIVYKLSWGGLFWILDRLWIYGTCRLLAV